MERYAVQTFTCTNIAPCAQGQNQGAGPGLYGQSKRGYGIQGATLFNSKSAAGAKAGLLGQDSATGTFNSGVLGMSTNGTGVDGSSTNGSGVVGVTTNSNASHAQEGVEGVDKSANSENDGVYGLSNKGIGVLGYSTSGFGAGGFGSTQGDGGILAASNGTTASQAALFAQATSGANLFLGVGAGTATISIDKSANISTTGQIFTSGSCAAGCVVSTRVRSYATTAAAPTIEDTGEAQLTFGGVNVRLDPAFANAIDIRQGYVVLITPEGDAHGLYVAQRTAAGFTVRESMNGRSNTPFAYRIVAHPFGVREARLPFVQTRSRQAFALSAER